MGGKGLRKPPAPSLLSMPVRLLRRLTGTALSGRHSVARREATMPGCRAAAASQRKKEKGPICLKRRRCPVAEPKPQARQRKRVQRGKRRQREVEREEQNYPSQTRAERRGQTNKGQPRDSADERKRGKGRERGGERKGEDNEKGSRASSSRSLSNDLWQRPTFPHDVMQYHRRWRA